MSISREQLFIASGIIKIVDVITSKAYKEIEEKIWREDLDNSPHGQPWHTSFHASSFPGDDPVACGRKAVYGLINTPSPTPIGRLLRSVADSGKAIEEELVKRWGAYGRLLSADVGAQFQTGFVDVPSWLTGNTDAALLPYRWKRPHIIEVKSKAHDKVLAMKNHERGPDKKHRLQVLTYIGLAHELHPWKQIKVNPDTWKIEENGSLLIELEPCIDGTIYYVSRDDPSTTHEFTYTYDAAFMAQGRAKLAEWKEAFESETIPAHPRGTGKRPGWSKDPCTYCDLKAVVCKPDHEAEITDLRQSHALDYAKMIWHGYDYDSMREKVLERWMTTQP